MLIDPELGASGTLDRGSATTTINGAQLLSIARAAEIVGLSTISDDHYRTAARYLRQAAIDSERICGVHFEHMKHFDDYEDYARAAPDIDKLVFTARFGSERKTDRRVLPDTPTRAAQGDLRFLVLRKWSSVQPRWDAAP